MSDYARILTHPDKESIVQKLVSGETAAKVSSWLKSKYNDEDQKHLALNADLLHKFTSENIDLYKQMDRDLSEVKKKGPIPESLKNNKVYKERLEELASKEVDIKKSIENCVHILETRLEQVYDKIQQNPDNLKGDYVLDKYISSLMLALERYDKIINNRPDQVIQHNYTVQMLDNHVAVFQEAIRKVLCEFDPDTANRFMDLLAIELDGLKQPSTQITPQKRFIVNSNAVKKLNRSVNDVIQAEGDMLDEPLS